MPSEPRSLAQVVEQLDLYPIDAFHFVQQGLAYAVEQVHTGLVDPQASRHITGQQLCEGLREYALMKWGLMARTVLRRWNINSTFDFGRIVFAMIENDMMKKTESDTIEDFRDVYDFRTAFETGYRIPPEPVHTTGKGRA